MKKTIILPILGLLLVAALFLTASSVPPAPETDWEATFEDFLAQFPTQQLPYTITENSLRLQLDQYVAGFNKSAPTSTNIKPRHLDWHFYKFLPNLATEATFSRMPMEVEPVALLVTTDNYAIIYKTSRSYGYGFSTYSIAVLDKKGPQISCNEVGKVMPEKLISFTIAQNLQAEQKTWHIQWKKNYDRNGLEGNMIKDLAYVESKSLDLMMPTPLPLTREQRFLSPKTKAPAQEVTSEGSKTK